MRAFLDPSQTSIPAVKTMDAQARAQGQSSTLNTSFFTYGYVVGQIMKDVIAKCGSGCTSVKFNTTLASIGTLSTNGLTGPLGFFKGGNELVHYAGIYGWSKSQQKSVSLSGWINGAQ
jgi:hypothetical protein